MDRSQLDLLASAGFAAFPPEQLEALARWCGDHCAETGDASYGILQDLLELVDDARDGPMQPGTAQELNDVVIRDLSAVIEEEDREAARVIAVAMRSEIIDILWNQELEAP